MWVRHASRDHHTRFDIPPVSILDGFAGQNIQATTLYGLILEDSQASRDPEVYPVTLIAPVRHGHLTVEPNVFQAVCLEYGLSPESARQAQALDLYLFFQGDGQNGVKGEMVSTGRTAGAIDY
jgi:hypothetical protein